MNSCRDDDGDQAGSAPAGAFYEWRKKFHGLSVSDAKRLRALEEENRRLKVMVADLSLDNTMLKDVLSKKW